MRISILLALFGSAAVQAQISLENPEHVPVPGLTFSVNLGPFVTPGAGGANQVWDFSSMVATGVDTLYFVDPASTPSGADFTSSTVALFDGDQDYSYFQATATEFLLNGNDDGNYAFPMSDPSKYWPYPCNFNDTWSDGLGGSVIVQAQTVTRAGTVSGIADGYGTLLLPFGPVDDVLRVVVDEDYQDAVSIITAIHDVQTHYYFKRFLPFPVFKITNRSTSVNGSVTTLQTAQWVDSAAVGLLERWNASLDAQLVPNPASGLTTLIFNADGDVEVSVVDLAGRAVLTQQLKSLSPGVQTHMLDVSTLAKGTYVVRLMDSNGAVGARKLIVD
jgi:Secretion system C-terminal sorting domain